MKSLNRSTNTSRKSSLVSTMQKGFNFFEDINFRSRSLTRPLRRIKTDPNSEVEVMLKERRSQC